MFWDELTRGDHRGALKHLLQVQSWWIAPLVLLPVLTVLVLRSPWPGTSRHADASFAVLFAVFTTGLSTMAMQVALLFSFQSIYGFIYETVGLIVAIFMLGLAAGAWLTLKIVKVKTSMRTLALVQGIMALLACLMALMLPRTASLTSSPAILGLFTVLTVGAGLINGMDFPLATACSMAHTGRAEKSAGLIYGLELLGACAGAALASAVVAPILGLGACFHLAAAANGAAFICILLVRRPHD
jgi:spermidine synthase